MQMQLMKHVTFFCAFILTYSRKMEKVVSLMETTQFQAGMQVRLPLVQRANCPPHRPEAPRSLSMQLLEQPAEHAQMQHPPDPTFSQHLSNSM